MKILQINQSDFFGGAARAAYRIHQSLRALDVDSRMWVDKAGLDDRSVSGPNTPFEKLNVIAREQLGAELKRFMKTENEVVHSASVLRSRWTKRLNESDADVVNLHWVQGEMLSISDIGRIEKPLVWTLHDMWAFCGAEHYTTGLRWQEGYNAGNRPEYETGFDLNRWTWRRKVKHWRKPIQIITPSCWLAECVRRSALMHDWPVNVIPNAIDTDRWCPLERSRARELLRLPGDVPLLLFGAMKGGNDPRKGFDLLLESLSLLRGQADARQLELVVFGQLAPEQRQDAGFKIHYMGHLHDDLTLRVLYSAVDALVLPSRLDNLPNTGLEAQACGTPVVAFDIGGLSDIVEHQHNGYLAKAFDTEDLADGMLWCVRRADERDLSERSRERAMGKFSHQVVAAKYRGLYESLLGQGL